VQVPRDQRDGQQFWLALLGAVRQATGRGGGAGPPAATPEFNAAAMAGRVLACKGDLGVSTGAESK
jgi:LuxR family maltose regulon positive regulatory protein